MTREKKPLLDEIGSKMAIDTTGLEHYSQDTPSLIVANHTCLRDIFVVPASLPEASKIVLSSRLMWKRNTPENSARRTLIENSLYGVPLEVHGGRDRLNIGLELATRALMEGWSVVIFPEGAYIRERQVNKARTGAARILFNARYRGVYPQTCCPWVLM